MLKHHTIPRGQSLPEPHAVEQSLNIIRTSKDLRLILDVLPVQVYSAALDGQLKRWNLEDGSCLHSILIGKPIHSMVSQSASAHPSATHIAEFLRHASGNIFLICWHTTASPSSHHLALSKGFLPHACPIECNSCCHWPIEPHASGRSAGGNHCIRLLRMADMENMPLACRRGFGNTDPDRPQSGCKTNEVAAKRFPMHSSSNSCYN